MNNIEYNIKKKYEYKSKKVNNIEVLISVVYKPPNAVLLSNDLDILFYFYKV